MIIEFAGNPGIGKSTLCNRVTEALNRQGIRAKIIYKDERAWPILRKKLFHYRCKYSPQNSALRRSLSAYAALYPGKTTDRYCMDILRAELKLRSGIYRDQQVLLMDEGPTQFITSIPHMNPLDEKADELIQNLNKTVYSHPVILFNILSDPAANMARIHARGKQDRFSDTREDLDAMLKIKRANLDYSMSHLHYQQKIDIVNDDLDRATAEITDLLMRILKQG